MCLLFAATYPQRTPALVVIGGYARRLRAEDYPFGSSPEDYEAFVEDIRELGRAGGARGARPEPRRRRAFPSVVGPLSAYEREP